MQDRISSPKMSLNLLELAQDVPHCSLKIQACSGHSRPTVSSDIVFSGWKWGKSCSVIDDTWRTMLVLWSQENILAHHEPGSATAEPQGGDPNP
jgi:hypothetical protein